MASKEDTAVVDVKTERVENPVRAGNGNRGTDGRFLPGKSGNKSGNPLFKRITEYRSAILEATTKEQLLEIWEVLRQHALKGEAWAVREYFDRLLGKDPAAVIMQQLNVDGQDLVKIIKGVDQALL